MTIVRKIRPKQCEIMLFACTPTQQCMNAATHEILYDNGPSLLICPICLEHWIAENDYDDD